MTQQQQTIPAITLETIARGVAPELFDRELVTVIDNLNDVNADPAATREITLKFKFKPTKGKDSCTIVVLASSKLGTVRPAESFAYYGQRNGKNVMSEHVDPNQGNLNLKTKQPAGPAGEKE